MTRTTLIDACLTCGENPRDVRRPDSTFHGMSIPGVMAAVCSECQAKVEPPRPRVLPTVAELVARGIKPLRRPKLVQKYPADWPTDEQYQRWLRGLDYEPAPTLQSAGLMPEADFEHGDPEHARDEGFAPEVVDFKEAGGWHIEDPNSGKWRGGLTAHRGVLFPGEFVDRLSLRDAVLERLGFTLEQVNSVYKQGRKSDDQRQLRDKIDESLLALSRDGAMVSKLSEALLLDDNVVTSALSRARAARLA